MTVSVPFEDKSAAVERKEITLTDRGVRITKCLKNNILFPLMKSFELTEAYPEAVLLSACAWRGQREGRGRVEGLILLSIRQDSQPQHPHQVPVGHPRKGSRFQPENHHIYMNVLKQWYWYAQGETDKKCFSNDPAVILTKPISFTL